MQSITTVTQKGQITLPIAIRELLNIKTYDRVTVSLEKGRIIVKPIVDVLDLADSISPKTHTPVLRARKQMDQSYHRI